ncbi:MAG: flagellar export protein FliJ [Deltaproteobacteria bacterium]|nr:flagellar export protein FliJ [Deltaproteobacteria bacterium]MDP7318669.1 flagellar export protein FliJ [SAR324 cluster bacterium]MDP7463452.1 flagellar export protein FliJ [SAR324 cluster bacterium]MDP7631045.1 flagellar export protein FliJ [SAR324 cluster bacterium]
MKKFRLQTALKVRERLEKLYQKALAQEVQTYQKLLDQCQVLHESQSENRTALDTSKQHGFTMPQLQVRDRFEQRLQYLIEISETQIQQQAQMVEVKQQELIGATQKKRILEILQEKQEREEHEIEEREAGMEADEIAQNLWRRPPET